MDQKILKQALARHHLQMKAAKPTARAALGAILKGEALGDIPEYGGPLPNCYPYSLLAERLARQLAFCAEAIPDKAADLQGLWLSI